MTRSVEIPEEGVVKDHALAIGSQLATIEDNVGRCMGMVMQAAIYSQSGVLDSAVQEAARMKSEVQRLQNLLVDMQAAMQR